MSPSSPRSRAPGLAQELDDLIQAIERAERDPDPVPPPAARDPRPAPVGAGHEALSELRAQLDRQRDDLMARIRRQRGLQDFLLPPPTPGCGGRRPRGRSPASWRTPDMAAR
ncbi:hypothetical protein [Nonomuraea sp. NPDC023979]|uniref:hypothetical protein n=1 Tax=Nonomuraea sp. NPDC023979 TaxID=3154796 RepID=UPI00340F7A09